ncbi:uncharacterized protein LOC132935800 [Metopolophium dirhodum]|uniref:uncharacterized protein LOC132935800 n=1 Tax=Metopolophium dirhodum TaxID=44670 RepID=UPI00298FBC8B|nr:uncharacterized protein LOC132935800 [Metopolophium dirhodum]
MWHAMAKHHKTSDNNLKKSKSREVYQDCIVEDLCSKICGMQWQNIIKLQIIILRVLNHGRCIKIACKETRQPSVEENTIVIVEWEDCGTQDRQPMTENIDNIFYITHNIIGEHQYPIHTIYFIDKFRHLIF